MVQALSKERACIVTRHRLKAENLKKNFVLLYTYKITQFFHAELQNDYEDHECDKDGWNLE